MSNDKQTSATRSLPTEEERQLRMLAQSESRNAAPATPADEQGPGEKQLAARIVERLARSNYLDPYYREKRENLPWVVQVVLDAIKESAALTAPTGDDALLARLEAAEAVIAKLPKTADGVPITPGQWLHYPTDDDKCPVFATVATYSIRDGGFSTREAALSASLHPVTKEKNNG